MTVPARREDGRGRCKALAENNLSDSKHNKLATAASHFNPTHQYKPHTFKSSPYAEHNLQPSGSWLTGCPVAEIVVAVSSLTEDGSLSRREGRTDEAKPTFEQTAIDYHVGKTGPCDQEVYNGGLRK